MEEDLSLSWSFLNISLPSIGVLSNLQIEDEVSEQCLRTLHLVRADRASPPLPLRNRHDGVHPAVGAGDGLGQRLGRSSQVGEDEPGVGPLGRRLGPDDDPALDRPGPGGIPELAEAPDLVRLAGSRPIAASAARSLTRPSRTVVPPRPKTWPTRLRAHQLIASWRP